MNQTLLYVLLGLAGILILWLGSCTLVLLVRGRRSPVPPVDIHASLERMKEIGELSVFRVFTKEIATSVRHPLGDTLGKYLSWVYSEKKMVMIFEFEIDFRHDLRRADFQIAESRPGKFTLTLPPCSHQTSIHNLHFYDERGGALLPWLLPELLNGFLGCRFSEKDRNALKDGARHRAEGLAKQLIGQMQGDAEQSAKRTLEAIARGFGATSIAFEFRPAREETVARGLPTA